MAASYIRSIRFTVGHDQVRFTVQTDVNEWFDFRRIRLTEIINDGYTRDEFIALGENCYNLMRDRTFLFYETDENSGELGSVLFQLGGEITLTREWMDVRSYDIYMNCVFFNQALNNE